MQWLREHSTVSGKVGLYGASRGAEHAILMARDGLADLPDAVAVHSPSDTIAGAFIAGRWHPKEQETWDPSKRAWRWCGSSEGLTRRVHATIGKQIAVSWSGSRSSLLSGRGARFLSAKVATLRKHD